MLFPRALIYWNKNVSIEKLKLIVMLFKLFPFKLLFYHKGHKGSFESILSNYEHHVIQSWRSFWDIFLKVLWFTEIHSIFSPFFGSWSLFKCYYSHSKNRVIKGPRLAAKYRIYIHDRVANRKSMPKEYHSKAGWHILR